MLFAEILVSDVEPVADLVAHRRGDADSARLRYKLKSRRHIDAIAEDIAFFDDHVAQIDADTVKEGARRRHVTIAPRHALLEIHGTAECLGDALKFHEHPVTGGLNNTTLTFGDRRVDQLQPHGLKPRESTRLIDFHETAEADDIRR